MLFSFATFAVSLWLGLVAVACLHRIWRARANAGGGHGCRDYPSATSGENHQRHRDFSSAGPISVARRSLVSISCAVINVIQAGLSLAFQWIAKIFRSSESPRDSGSRLPPTAVEVSNSPSGSQPAPQSSGSTVSAPSDASAGAAQRKRARRALKETPEPQLKSAERRLRKNDNQQREKAVRTVSKSGKDHSAKKSRNMNTAATGAAKKTSRTKRKISPASRSSLTPKASV